MSPDEHAGPGLGGLLATATRRIRMLALAEAAAWGLVVAAVSPVAGVLTAMALAAWRWRAARRVEIVRTFEHALPSARNLFVTADEIERNLLAATTAVRERVLGDAAANAAKVDLGIAYPAAPAAL